MQKNDFLLLNDLIYQLYTETSLSQLKQLFLRRIKQLIPYSYGSILMTKETAEGILLTDPVCIPDSFRAAELEYLQMVQKEDIDHTNWIMYSSESEIMRESDVLKDQNRLSSQLYQKCYRHYNIFDTLQLSIVYNKKCYGILILYRTREEGPFSEDEMFYLKAFSKHLNYIFYTLIEKPVSNDDHYLIAELTMEKNLTKRESEILGMIFQGMNNQEILDKIFITDHTLQKHIQNIYRKCEVSTRWDLLKLKQS